MFKQTMALLEDQLFAQEHRSNCRAVFHVSEADAGQPLQGAGFKIRLSCLLGRQYVNFVYFDTPSYII